MLIFRLKFRMKMSRELLSLNLSFCIFIKFSFNNFNWIWKFLKSKFKVLRTFSSQLKSQFPFILSHFCNNVGKPNKILTNWKCQLVLVKINTFSYFQSKFCNTHSKSRGLKPLQGFIKRKRLSADCLLLF